MKKIKFLWIVCVLFLASTGCKKEETQTTNTEGLTVDEAGRLIFQSDIDGALYSYIVKTIYADPSDNESSNIAFAWFGDQNKCLDAGEVSVNENSMIKPIISGLWYTDIFDDIFGTGSSIRWVVEGSSAVKGYSHVDNSSMPVDANYSLPASVDISKSFTINHNDTKAKGIIYCVLGNKGSFQKYVEGSSTSVTFTAAELGKAAYSQDLIGFKVLAINFDEKTIDGKKYVFVKVKQIQKETETK